MAIHPNLLRLQRRAQMNAINAARPIPDKKKFGGVIYHLSHVYMYKSGAEHEAEWVRNHGGMARVVEGSILVGKANPMKMNGWRVYTREG